MNAIWGWGLIDFNLDSPFFIISTYLYILVIILNINFFASDESSTNGKVGFGFGIAAWALGLLGLIFMTPYYVHTRII